MEPKDKAIELINSFKPLVTTWDCYHDEPRDGKYIAEDAKKCALISVESTIKALEEYDNYTEEYLQKDFPEFWSCQKQNMEWDFRYWEKVKQEIIDL